MGRNKKGGKKNKKRKNHIEHLYKRELIKVEKNSSQAYFTITKMLGDGRCLGNGSDGKIDVLCIIRGNMKKKVWIHTGDIVLGSYRDFSAKPIADIIQKYTNDEIQLLKQQGELLSAKKSVDDIEEFEESEEIFTFENL